MAYLRAVQRFGNFELDETARSLKLRGEAIELQPKIFDLLVFLTRNAGRVVSKAEIMDAIWPDVIVTEASLQRAASLLRTVLRDGGLDSALKSFPRHGYRFSVDQPDLKPLLPEPVLGVGIDAARAAIEERDWSKAAELFAASEPTLGAEDYELWAFAIECHGSPSDSLAHYRTALERYESAGAHQRAAHCAVTVAKIHLERGELPVANGWLARAAPLLAGAGLCETQAYLLWMRSRALVFAGRPEEALSFAEQAHAAARTCGSLRMQALALVYKGFYNVTLGRTREGLEQQDHAAALALSSAVDPITGAIIYCNILWSCRGLGDWARAGQWSEGFEAWCQANFAKTSPSCELHRAEVQGVKGTLAEALAGIHRSIKHLPATDPWAIGDAYRVQGDIRAAIGDLDAAREDYAMAYKCGWDAEPGNAVLLHEAGDTDGAIAALDRALANANWFGLQRRGWLLANKARICALAGREPDARACLKLIAETYDDWPSAAVRALALEAEANLPRNGDAASALQQLHLARQLWTSIGSDYQAARLRLELARVMLVAGDRAGALVEAHCAFATAERIGASVLKRDAAALTGTADAK
ncbi:winged helix-turn-helix domain-containing protein [Terricaulis sp.]|uniref:winged helix-turn-helix domain-containing protein n=1 Tax=Terricaulis sp. TaxID=2768686 RepID=UPI0037832239